jgi:two-component system cell cycle response regulator CtrA
MRILVVTETGATGSALTQQLARSAVAYDCAARGDTQAYLQAYDYDALLLALPAPGPLLAFLRRVGEKRPVLVLTAGDATVRAELFNLGADDVVPTLCEGSELAARLRAIVRREHGHACADLVAGAAHLRLGRMEIALRGEVVPLTPKEYAILELLFLRRGLVHAKSTIMNHVYGAEDGPALRTLDVIVCKLRKKLALHGAPDLVATVWGSGLTLRELPERTGTPSPMRPERAAA